MNSGTLRERINTMSTNEIRFRKALEEDISGACELINENFVGNLAESQKGDGFLSICFDWDQLKEMADDGVMIVALSGSQVVGFLCTQTCEYNRKNIPHAKTMIEKLSGEIDEQSTLVCGPVCVSSSFRGLGIFERMYAALEQEADGIYSAGITFISESNPRSIAAHVDKVGMSPAGDFGHDSKKFKIFRRNF